MGTGDDEHADWEAEEMSGFIYRDFWALLWPDGRWFIDTDGKSQTDCWKIGLGWPAVTRLKLPNQWALGVFPSQGARPAIITRSLRNDLSMHGHC